MNPSEPKEAKYQILLGSDVILVWCAYVMQSWSSLNYLFYAATASISLSAQWSCMSGSKTLIMTIRELAFPSSKGIIKLK